MNPYEYLEIVAGRLGDLRDEVVFVGGMVRGLLTTDPVVPGVRPTFDVDVIVEINSRAEWAELEPELRRLGFKPDMRDGAPLCRYILEEQAQEITVDLMPLDEKIFGFSNEWYPSAYAHAEVHALSVGEIRVIDAVHFVATKLAAFQGRGGGDYYHHDLEDVVVVIDGRPEFEAELGVSPSNVRDFISTEVRRLLTDVAFHTSLPGHLPPDGGSQARLPHLLERLETVAQLGLPLEPKKP